MKRKYFIIFTIIFMPLTSLGMPELNLNHLEFLRDEFQIENETKIGYWIYAEKYGDKYVHTEAKGEGVTCVDDVARVAVLYTELYKLDNNEFYLQRAKEALDFVMAFQDTDGDFYNFVFEDGSINKQGITSRKSANWWAARGFWSISNALEIFENDKEFQKKLENSAKLAYNFLSKNLDENYFLNHNSDVSSVFLMGVVEYYKYTKDEKIKDLAIKIGDSILSKQIKDGFLKGAFDEGEETPLWHSWGSRQGEALLELYKITQDDKYLKAVKLLADEFYPVLLSLGPVYQISEYIMLYPQIAYGVEPIESTLVKLYSVSKDDNYAYMASLFGGFFEKNNNLKTPMYGPNGEGYDSLHSVYINTNSGAESTICALLSITRLKILPMKFQEITEAIIVSGRKTNLLEAEKMNTGIYSFTLDNINNIALKTDESIRIRQTLKDFYPGEYEIYVSGIFEPNTTVKVTSGENSEEVTLKSSKGISSIGKIHMSKNEIILYFKPDGGNIYIDQVIIKPVDHLFVYKLKDNYYEFSKTGVKQIEYAIADVKSQYVQKVEVPIEKVNESYLFNLEELFNNDGIVDYANRKSGNFDNFDGVIGAKYPVEELQKKLDNNVFYFEKEDVYFKFKTEGVDNLICTSQEIYLKNFDVSPSNLYIVGSCDHGNYEGYLTIVYSDETIEENRIAFSDWCQDPAYGETILMEFDYRYDNLGIKENITTRLYLNKIVLKEKPIKSIFLPQIPTMHIFAITLK